ncbi:Hypothetical predicted protein [Octopus vulgaris]|uniref:Uncharacterized protein n=1 Tax=Octopus vulgaris TaxID=6645 RepID=A0AA36BE68_OCTVU|nr:Hypothetical predicted protein [Octopus vulgaris]
MYLEESEQIVGQSSQPCKIHLQKTCGDGDVEDGSENTEKFLGEVVDDGDDSGDSNIGNGVAADGLILLGVSVIYPEIRAGMKQKADPTDKLK